MSTPRERLEEYRRRYGHDPNIDEQVMPDSDNPYAGVQVSPENAQYNLELNRILSGQNYQLRPGMKGYQHPVRRHKRPASR